MAKSDLEHLASAMKKTLPPKVFKELLEHLDPLTPFVAFLREVHDPPATEGKKRVTIYVHASDEQMWKLGERTLHLSGEALSMFSHAGDEFKVTLEVDMATGLAKAVMLDGRTVA
jgi:hypothetical protein